MDKTNLSNNDQVSSLHFEKLDEIGGSLKSVDSIVVASKTKRKAK